MQPVWYFKDREMIERELEGRMGGTIGTFQSILPFDFDRRQGAGLDRLSTLLEELDDLELEKTRQYSRTASSLADLEDYVANLLQARDKGGLEPKKSA